MSYIHREVQLGSRDIVRVTLEGAAVVRILDSSNYDRYRRNGEYSFRGGIAKASPVSLRPGAGHWHIVVDRDGYRGSFRAAIDVVKIS